MFCGNCGYEVKGDAKFCPKCGKEILNRNVPGQYLKDVKEKNIKSDRQPLLITIICIALIVCIFIFGYRDSKSDLAKMVGEWKSVDLSEKQNWINGTVQIYEPDVPDGTIGDVAIYDSAYDENYTGKYEIDESAKTIEITLYEGSDSESFVFTYQFFGFKNDTIHLDDENDWVMSWDRSK